MRGKPRQHMTGQCIAHCTPLWRRWRAEAPTCQNCFLHNSLSFIALAATICGIGVRGIISDSVGGTGYFTHVNIVNFSTRYPA